MADENEVIQDDIENPSGGGNTTTQTENGGGNGGTGNGDTQGSSGELSEEEKANAVRLLFYVVFENIVPWGSPGGDTGLTSRLKLQRNFEKIKAWIDASPSFFLSKLYDDIAFGHITFNKGLTANGWTDDAGIEHPGLEVKGDSTFTGNLSTPEFLSAFFGGNGWAIQKKEVVNAAGVVEYKYHLEIDDVTIRSTLRVFEQIVSQLLGENANRYFSDMMEVDHYDPETGRVYLTTDGGRLYNPFRVGDIIRVQQYNDDPSEENNWYVTKAYELRITAAGLGNRDDGEDRLDWVEFDNFSTTMEDGSALSLIQKRDTFVRWDNDRDPNRKGLVSIMAVGENTPYMDILYGQKTDPEHALKGRIGNLEGVRTDLFGWLEGFGAYINNLYGVGKFFNYQTGESLTASMQMTRELFRRVYTETIYNISDDDNFISNGFFQHDLEDWVKCAAGGGTAPADTETEMLGVDEGDGATPILINGVPMAVSSKLTAETVDKDGINVLHLYGMGVSQNFSLIKANGTHEVMASGNTSDATTTSVPDKLYMAVRILPVTAGRLSVRFLKQNGLYSGWERDIDNAIGWQLYQATDNSDQPWDYTGSGKLVVSYTGECYIRFVALTTDAVANSWEQYATKFEQNARRITISASKQSADLTEAVASINIQFDNITTTVTNNKSAADRALANLTSDLSTEVSARQSLEQTWHATWVYQNDHLLSLMAGEFNSDGTIKGYADLKVQVSGISTTVTNNKSAADTAFGNINSSLSSLWSYAESIDDEQGASATWISQNKNKWQAVAASFNSDGTVKASGNVGLYVSNQMSWFTVEADKINFIFTKETSFYAKNGDDLTEVVNINPNGDLWIKGEYKGGKISGDVTVGTGTNRMVIRPNAYNGAELVGINSGNDEILKLGFTSADIQTSSGTYNLSYPKLDMGFYRGGTRFGGLEISPSGFSITSPIGNQTALFNYNTARVSSVYAEAFNIKTSSNTWAQGISGSFTAGSKTITVKGGIITNIS